MKITVIGTGYVGLVTGTCLAEAGNDVLCIDIDKVKVAKMQNGEVPIYEPSNLAGFIFPPTLKRAFIMEK
jgi:UDPglucose 6-dehydrogenase